MAASAEPESLEGRRFSFYPAIRNVEHNEWTLARETWSELLVANCEGGFEVWIPRKYLTGISSSDSPVLIVGLNRELEFKAGSLWPYRQKVVELPIPREGPKPAESDDASIKPAAPSSNLPGELDIGRFIAVALAVGLSLVLVAVILVFEGIPDPLSLFRADISTADQRYLALASSDGYHDVVLKIGRPEQEQWLTREDAEIQYQLLRYTSRSYAVALLGGNRRRSRYIGTIHLPSRRTLDAAQLSGGGSTASLLKNLPDF